MARKKTSRSSKKAARRKAATTAGAKKSTRRKAGGASSRKTGKKPSRRSASRQKQIPVRVRMYRTGLGDCFLVTFDPGGDEKHMLIDCGTLGAKTAPVSMKSIVDQIIDDTKGNLRVLIATHEHLDHVSGFRSYGELLREELDVDNVWLAWTEDPDDQAAQDLVKHRGDLRLALTSALAAAPRGCDAVKLLRGVMGFVADSEGAGPFAASAFAKTVDAAMHFVKTEFVDDPRFLGPDQKPFEESWLPGFRFYVLGPPRSREALKELGDHGSAELYGLRAALAAADPGAPIRSPFAEGASPEDRARDEEHSPFDNRWRCHDAADAAAWYPGYFAPAGRWRSIDEDWLSSAAHLALQLDSMTNNTSLVLAIERIADGKVLLFPADAQEGNWVSWHDDELQWTVEDGRGVQREVNAADLLRRTVFYKVGHHASHNATARAKGLELMGKDGELVAFIPVDRAMALSRSPEGTWRMPARPLYRRLLEKCNGLVVRADIGFAQETAPAGSKRTESELAGIATKAEWAAWIRSQSEARSSGRIALDSTGSGKHPRYIDFVLR